MRNQEFWESWKGGAITVAVVISAIFFFQWMSGSVQGQVAIIIGFIAFVWLACYARR